MTAISAARTAPIWQTDNPRSLIAMIAAIAVGEGSLLSMPFMVGGIVERYGLAESASGIVTAVQFVAMSVVAIILARVIHRIDRRRWAVLAGIMITIGHGIAIISPSWQLFLIGRIIAGLGEGAALSIANAAAAGTRHPQRTFSQLTIAMVVTAIGIYLAMPALARSMGTASVFYVLTGLALFTLPALFWMPSQGLADTDRKDAAVSVWRPFPWILVGIAGLFIGGNMLWAYSERIATANGIGIADIAWAFMATVVISGVGPLAASYCERRWGNRIPILLGALVLAAGNFTLAISDSWSTFLAGIVTANVAFVFLMPYYRSLTAFLDPLGRLAVGSVVAQTVGTACAPFLGGVLLLAGAGYTGLGVAAIALALLSFMLVAGVARKADSARSKVAEKS